MFDGNRAKKMVLPTKIEGFSDIQTQNLGGNQVI